MPSNEYLFLRELGQSWSFVVVVVVLAVAADDGIILRNPLGKLLEMFVSVHLCAPVPGGQRLMSIVFLNHSPPYLHLSTYLF